MSTLLIAATAAGDIEEVSMIVANREDAMDLS
jgi:hypothetical protein